LIAARIIGWLCWFLARLAGYPWADATGELQSNPSPVGRRWRRSRRMRVFVKNLAQALTRPSATLSRRERVFATSQSLWADAKPCFGRMQLRTATARTSRYGSILALVCQWLLLADCCWAQVTPATPPAAAATESIHEVKPDVFYLKDKEGHLQPVLGFTLEDFERLLTQGAARGPGQTRPGYRLEKIVASGEANKDFAQLTLAITVFVDDKDWVRVPMRLGAAVVRGEATYEGPGEYFLEFDDATEEYIAWFHGQSDKPHVVTLDVLAPLTQVAGETRLKLSAPRAWTSELDLKVPVAKAVGQVSPGAVIEETKSEENATRFKILGLSSDFMVSWRAGDSHSTEIPTVLEATGGLLTKIDGRSINTQAQLTVRSFGGEFDTFRVRLPPGATLLTGDQPDYSIKPVSDGGKPAGGAKGEIVEVRLRNRTVGPVVVRMAVEQSHQMLEQAAWRELGGFEVLGAVRQWGHIGVQVVGDWQVLWGDRSLVRQVEDVPAELWRDDMLAGFEYFAQPFSLLVRVVPRQTRISVEATDLVMVGAQRIELESRLKYRVGGAKVFALEVALPGWQLDDVGPASMVKIADLISTQLAPLSIPLLEPASGEFELVIHAHREIASGSESLEFAFPQPKADGAASSTAIVLPADNVDLAPREAELKNLTRQYTKPTIQLPPRQQAPLVYRSDAADATFSADLRVHNREISVAVNSRVTLSQEGGSVDQQLSYNIAREAVDVLTLTVPSAIVEAGKLEISLAGQPLTWAPLDDETNQADGPTRVRVALRKEQIGLCELTVRYPLANEKPIPQASVPLHIPLVMPAAGELASNDLTIAAREGIRFRLLDGLWHSADAESKPQGGAAGLRLSANSPRDEVVVGVRLQESRDTESTIVERAWIQTMLTEHARQDRVVYRLITSEHEFHLKLPSGVQHAEVFVNDSAVAPEEGLSSEEITIPLPPAAMNGPTTDGPSQTYTVDLRYRFLDRRAGRASGELALQAPTLDQNAWVQRCYWQLVLPQDEHLLSQVSTLSEECRWGWQGFHWGRQPLMDQFQLETWSHAAHAGPLPEGTNRYLFSSAGSARLLETRTASRSLLVLVSSGAILLVGLLLIYVSAARNPALLLVGVVSIGAVGLMFPNAALLLAQSAAIGLALALLGGWLKYSLTRRPAQVPVARSGGSSIMERGSTKTQVHYRAPHAGSQSTTTAAAAQLSLPESKS
jgi:hypothetical protein